MPCVRILIRSVACIFLLYQKITAMSLTPVENYNFLTFFINVTPHTCIIPVKTGMIKEKKNKGEDQRCERLLINP